MSRKIRLVCVRNMLYRLVYGHTSILATYINWYKFQTFHPYCDVAFSAQLYGIFTMDGLFAVHGHHIIKQKT